MKMEIEFPDDFLSGLLDSDIRDIAEEALKEAAPVLLKSVKESCRDRISTDRTELVDSFRVWDGGVVKTKTDAYMLGVSVYGKPAEVTHWNSVSASGRSRDRITTNNDIAWWLEKGNAHQPARPFLDSAAGRAQAKVMDICQKVYDRKVGSGQ